MEYPKEGSSSLYDYSDKSIQHAGYAAIAYAVISTFSTGLSWFQAPTTPWLAVVIVALVIGLFFGALAFGIFKKSRVAVSVMLVFVVGLQLYTWFVLHSGAGSILSVIVTGFLLRGARRIFQDHAERKADTEKS
jgi:phosphatidylserine synthase